MARTPEQFQGLLGQLLPPGKVWSREPTSFMGALLLGLGDGFSRLDQRFDDLIEEAYPDTTDEMLPDWERMAGLPDPAIPHPVGRGARLVALQDRLVEIIDQSRGAYIDMIARLGYPGATISNGQPFIAGLSWAGCSVGDGGIRFWWEITITAPIGTPTPIVAVEHAVRRRLLVHLYVSFIYNLV